jgi:type IV secretory pathway VirB3-like protein
MTEKTLLLGGVPFHFFIANMIHTLVVMVTFQLPRYFWVGMMVHVGLYLCTSREDKRHDQ